MSNQATNERLDQAIKEAARQHSKDLEVLRMLKAALANEAIALRAQNKELSQANIWQVVRREVKKRQEAAKLYAAANRPALADKEQAELEVLSVYLPPAPSSEEIKEQIQRLKTELSLSDVKDRGRLTKAVLEHYQGLVDGGTVSNLIADSFNTQT
ncbi:MAG: GatB/YqeY domain-containing protein [Patescibacteria group bacterium]